MVSEIEQEMSRAANADINPLKSCHLPNRASIGKCSYWIEASTNLRDWMKIDTRSTANGVGSEFVDMGSANSPTRFYRARWVPGY